MSVEALGACMLWIYLFFIIADARLTHRLIAIGIFRRRVYTAYSKFYV